MGSQAFALFGLTDENLAGLVYLAGLLILFRVLMGVGAAMTQGTSMAMIIAACCATGRPCNVQNAEIVDRGYDRVEEKLQALGVDVVREPD